MDKHTCTQFASFECDRISNKSSLLRKNNRGKANRFVSK
jgi:hypothetical protein